MKRSLGAVVLCLLFLLGSTQSPQRASAVVATASGPLTWVDVAALPTPRYSAGVAVSPQGLIYVIGGDNWTCKPLTTVEEYDPRTDSWRARAELPTGRWALGAATGSDGLIYAIGGGGGEPCGASVLDTVEAYDPGSNTWIRRASMPTPRIGLVVVAGSNGKIYAMGGDSGSGVVSVVEEYDPVADVWTRKADMPVLNWLFAGVSGSNGRIYVIGGYGLSNRVWEFDPVLDTWTGKAPMPTGRDGLGAAQVRNGSIYAVGGFGPSIRLDVVEEYDPATDMWFPQASLGGVRTNSAVVAVRNFIYVIGGWGTRADGSEGPVGRVEMAKSRPR